MVPRQNNLKDIVDLSFDDQIILLKEINFVAEIFKKEFEFDKLNIANLGNVVSQLHIHVIARKKNDATFPRPVWGNAKALEYCGNNLTKTLEKIQKYFKNVDRKSD